MTIPGVGKGELQKSMVYYTTYVYTNQIILAALDVAMTVEDKADSTRGFNYMYGVNKARNNRMALDGGRKSAKAFYEAWKDSMKDVKDLSISSPVKVEMHSPELWSTKNDVYNVSVSIMAD